MVPHTSFTETPGPRLQLHQDPAPARNRAPDLLRNSLSTPLRDPVPSAARAPPTGNPAPRSQPRVLGTAQLMSNAPVPGERGRSRRRPTSTGGPWGCPDAQSPAPPQPLTGVPEPACRGEGARWPGRASGSDLRALRPPPRPQLHLPRPPPRPARERRAPRGGGAPRPGPLRPAAALT